MTIARTLCGVVVIVLACGAVDGCSIVNRPVPPPGFSGDGSCMCAICLDTDFCFDPATSTSSTPGATGCAPGSLRAQPSTRLVQSGTGMGTQNFFCVPPTSGAVLGTGGACAAGSARLAAKHVGRCTDEPVCARSLNDMCSVLPDPSSTCTDPFGNKFRDEQFRTYVPSFSTEGDLTQEGVQICAHFHHEPVPTAATGGAAPYCFLSCLNTARTTDCDPALFDPPSVRSEGDIVLQVGANPRTGAHAQVVVGFQGETATVNVTGVVHLNAAHCGPGRTCEASITWVEVHTDTPFSLHGVDFSNITLLNAQPLPDAITPITAGTSRLVIDSGGVLYASGDIGGMGRAGVAYTLTSPIEADLEWNQHVFELESTLGNADTQTSIVLMLQGSLPSIPPIAAAGPDRTVECASPRGTPVVLDGSGSSDPDDDLQHHVWSDETTGLNLGDSAMLSTALARGTHPIHLQVEDSVGQGDGDRVDIQVVDRTGPTFESVALSTGCLWPPNHTLHLFRLGNEVTAETLDACEGTSGTVRIVDVRSNQPAAAPGSGNTGPDVVFGDAAFCVRAERQGPGGGDRTYTVTLEATDADGNASRHDVTIRVPHDQRPADRCTTGDLAPTVDDDDARCHAMLPHASPTAGGGSGAAGAIPAGCAVAHTGPGDAPALLCLAGLAFVAARRTRRRRW